MTLLQQFGWDDRCAQPFEPFRADGYTAGRVAIEHKGAYIVYTDCGEITAEVSGRFRHGAIALTDYPTVGDWVVLRPSNDSHAIIHQVLPRRSQFIRKQASATTDAQIMATNVDTALLVSGLDQEFNLRRIERYLLLSWDSGANPVIVLNKADCCANLADVVGQVEAIAPGVPIVPLSAMNGEGIEALTPYLRPGQTLVLLGSSGVGKSTLTNRLLGTTQQATQAVRTWDSRGRHTTTQRHLMPLPCGALLIDTPGIRELQVWTDEASLNATFSDVETLASQCRFRDCQHGTEPDCAVRHALEAGQLERGRWRSYQKLQRELHYLERQQDVRAQLDERQRWKQIHKALRHHPKGRY